jgi:hypothetical protein
MADASVPPSGEPVGDADLLQTILHKLSAVQDLALDHARAWGAWRARRDDVASPPPAAGLALQQRTVELTRWAPALGRLVTVHRGAEGQTWEENFYDDFLEVSGRRPEEIAATANHWHHWLYKLAALIPSQSVASRESTSRGTGSLRWPQVAEPSAGKVPHNDPSYTGSGMLGCTELAELFEVNADALRKRLERWKPTHQDDWKEVQERRPRESKYLYRISAVLPIIEKLKAPGERPAE